MIAPRRSALIALWAIAMLCSCASGVSTPEELLPPTTSVAILIDKDRLEHDPFTAELINWAELRQTIMDLGFETDGLAKIGIAGLADFDHGTGTLILLASENTTPPRPVESGSETVLELNGLPFYPSPQDGFFWTTDDNWVAVCDPVGCEIAAPVLAGDTPSLLEAPPDTMLLPVLQEMPGNSPVAMLWIPTPQARDVMGTLAFLTQSTLDTFELGPISALLERFGTVRGGTIDCRSESGRIVMLARVAMDDAESAQFLSGTLSLLQSAGRGIEQWSQASGAQRPQGPPPPEVRVTSHENVVVVEAITDAP